MRTGALAAVHMCTDKVSGKLLKIRDNGAEIEGQGFYPFAEKLKIYRLYGTLKSIIPPTYVSAMILRIL